jgi:tetratricopeptide (TPR) repeat protein
MNILEQLQNFYKEDPNDAFNIYALAIEYLKHDTQKSEELFVNLLLNHSGYLPTYYHAGALFVAKEEFEKAIEVYEKGIILAENQGNKKALEELKRALKTAEDERDF